MLTKKEITFLNFLYKKFGGKNPGQKEVQDFIEDRIKLSSEKSYELAYLYVNNFDDAEGDFGNVKEPKRETHEEYMERLPWQLKAVMKIADDEDIKNYNFDKSLGSIVHIPEDLTYEIYEDYSDLESVARDQYDPCDNIDSYDDISESYFYITDTDRRIIATEESDNRVDNMDDDDIIKEAEIGDEIEALEELDNLRSQVEQKTEEMEELVDQLEDADESEKEEIESKITDFEREIEELENKIGDIESQGTKDELIEQAKEKLRSDYYDQIYDELGDPIDYFVHDHGYYDSVSELVDTGPVQFDCDEYTNDFFSDQDVSSLGYQAGYNEVDEVRKPDGNWAIIAWNP